MKSSKSLLLNQAETYLQRVRQNNPFLLGQVEFQFSSYIRLCTLWNQSRYVAEIKPFEGSMGISILSLK